MLSKVKSSRGDYSGPWRTDIWIMHLYVHAQPLTIYNIHATASVLEFMLYVLSPFTSAAARDFVSWIFYSSLFVSHGFGLYCMFEDLLNIVDKMKKFSILERKIERGWVKTIAFTISVLYFPNSSLVQKFYKSLIVCIQFSRFIFSRFVF